MTVQSLEQAVATLSPAELAEFRRWFAEFDAAAWDAKLEADANAGKLDAMAAQAFDEYKSGTARQLRRTSVWLPDLALATDAATRSLLNPGLSRSVEDAGHLQDATLGFEIGW